MKAEEIGYGAWSQGFHNRARNAHLPINVTKLENQFRIRVRTQNHVQFVRFGSADQPHLLANRIHHRERTHFGYAMRVGKGTRAFKTNARIEIGRIDSGFLRGKFDRVFDCFHYRAANHACLLGRRFHLRHLKTASLLFLRA